MMWKLCQLILQAAVVTLTEDCSFSFDIVDAESIQIYLYFDNLCCEIDKVLCMTEMILNVFSAQLNFLSSLFVLLMMEITLN